MPGNILETPPSVIASWPTPNYDNRTGVRRTWLPIFAIIFLVISSILMFVRTALRARKHGGGFGWDDAFLLPGWLLLLGFTICGIWSSEKGIIDRHVWDMEVEKYEKDALNAWIAQLLFIAGTSCVKISVLLFVGSLNPILRLFALADLYGLQYRRMVIGTFERRWKWAVWGAIIFTGVYTLVLFFLLVFNCSPTNSYWKSLDPEYKEDWKCADTKWVNYLAGILAVVSDFYSVCLPAVMLWPVEMARRQKMGLNVIFATGLVPIIAAGFRTNALVDLGTKYDLSWTGFWVYFWSLLEYNMGITCACAPSLRVFFRKYLKGSLQRSTASSSKRVFSTTCGKGDDESDMLPARGIELRRSLTMQSVTHFHSDYEGTGSDVQGEAQDMDYRTEESAGINLKKARRQGIIDVPVTYSNELARNETFFDSKSTLNATTNRRASTPPPMPLPPIATGLEGYEYEHRAGRIDHTTIGALMRGG